MPLLVNTSVGGDVLMWIGFAHSDHVQTSATLYAHTILTLRVQLTSEMSPISWRPMLPQPQQHATVREKPACMPFEKPL